MFEFYIVRDEISGYFYNGRQCSQQCELAKAAIYRTKRAADYAVKDIKYSLERMKNDLKKIDPSDPSYDHRVKFSKDINLKVIKMIANPVE